MTEEGDSLSHLEWPCPYSLQLRPCAPGPFGKPYSLHPTYWPGHLMGPWALSGSSHSSALSCLPQSLSLHRRSLSWENPCTSFRGSLVPK